jgi:hypothetical protein
MSVTKSNGIFVSGLFRFFDFDIVIVVIGIIYETFFCDINAQDFCFVGKRLEEGFAKAFATGSAINRKKKSFPGQRLPLRFVEDAIILMREPT